jgi:hypothetical protein
MLGAQTTPAAMICASPSSSAFIAAASMGYSFARDVEFLSRA